MAIGHRSAGDTVYADDIRSLRSELHAALLALGLYDATYTDPTLATGASGTIIKKAHITELRQQATGSSSAFKSISQFVTDFYHGVLHRAPSSGELFSGVNALASAQAQGAAALLAAAQSLGSTLFNSTEYTNLGTSNAQFVSDLYMGYLQRAADDSGYSYWLDQLNNHGDTRAHQITAFGLGEFENNVAALSVASGSSDSLHYVLTDIQGSARAMMNDNSSSSAVVARHDFLPFGEEIGGDSVMRTPGRGYGAGDTNRWKYGLTERDNVTGLDHTWWRKYESFSGRWTSPDPLGGNIGDPQSLNHYTYAGNDPVNLVDPSGLDPQDPPPTDHIDPATRLPYPGGVPGVNAGVVTIGLKDTAAHYSAIVYLAAMCSLT